MTDVSDLLVVGGGLAGLACGVRAVELDMRVRVLEQGAAERYPCNSRYSGGMFHLNYLDIADPPEQLADALGRMCPPDVDRDVVQAIARNSRRCVQWLQETAGARFVRVGPAAYEKWVLAPPRPPKAGLDHPGRGPDVVLGALARRLEARGMPLLRAARVADVQAVDDGGFVVTALCDGSPLHLRTRALVFADGGFQGRAAFIAQHIAPSPAGIVERNARSGIGTSLELAGRLGALVSGLGSFYGHLLSRNALHRTDLWPYPMIDGLAKAGVLLGPDGRRFADEGLTGVYLANAVARRADPTDALVVFDDATWWSVGRETRVPPNPVMTNHGGALVSSDTLAGLAARAGIDAQALLRTVAAHNDFVRSRGANIPAPARTFSAAWARPIQTPPFHAVPVCAGMTYTMGGLRVTPHAQVRGNAGAGATVPGLYAAGAAVGGVEGGDRAFYVGGLCKALVLGMLAAESARRQQRRPMEPTNRHDEELPA